GHLVLGQELPGLLGEQRPVGGRVDDHGLDLLPQQAALAVELVDGHQRDVLQRRLADRHGSRQRVEDPDLDGLLRARSGRENGAGSCPRCEPQASVHRTLSSSGPEWAKGGGCKRWTTRPRERLIREQRRLTFPSSYEIV